MTNARIEAALAYANRLVSAPWQDNAGWHYTVYAEGTPTGDYTNVDCMSYYTAVRKRRADMLGIAAQHLGFEGQTFDIEHIANKSNIAVLKAMKS